jgi:hypothetical protein
MVVVDDGVIGVGLELRVAVVDGVMGVGLELRVAVIDGDVVAEMVAVTVGLGVAVSAGGMGSVLHPVTPRIRRSISNSIRNLVFLSI